MFCEDFPTTTPQCNTLYEVETPKATAIRHLVTDSATTFGDLLIEARPSHTIYHDSWGYIDFSTGALFYTVPYGNSLLFDKNETGSKLLGMSSFAIYSGIVIVTRTCAFVAHYSSDQGVNPELFEFLVSNADRLKDGLVWIVHNGGEYTSNSSLDCAVENAVGCQLYRIVTQILGIRLDHVKILEQTTRQYSKGLEDPVQGVTEGMIMVDGRHSPEFQPMVLAHGYVERNISSIGIECLSSSLRRQRSVRRHAKKRQVQRVQRTYCYWTSDCDTDDSGA